MDSKRLINLAILIAIPIIMGFVPTPDGLTPLAWKLFGVYLSCIVGLVLKPFKEPVILLAGMTASAIIISINNKFLLADGVKEIIKADDVLTGYSSGTTWLVFAAFSLSVSFIITGLGKRIAYLLIRTFGSSVLRLGYVNVFLELLLSPGMPSNTARAGGVITPIFNSVSQALGSDPEESPKKAGRFLLMNVYMVTKQTSALFMTGMAPNALALKMLSGVNPKFNISWTQWFLAASAPIIICLFLTPIVTYMLCTPELKKVDNKTIAKKGLEELGPIKTNEKVLLGVFSFALIGWILGGFTGINETTTAILAMSILLITSIISWDDLLKSKGGWSTLIWYGGIIGLSSVLTKVEFFPWLGETLKESLGGLNLGGPLMIISIILLISVMVRYVFASGSAYVVAMVPVFGFLGNALLGEQAINEGYFHILAIGLLLTNSIGGLTTHYGGAAAPIVFAYGYNDTNSWWKVGNVLGYGSLIIICTLGIVWFRFLISMGLISI